MTDFQSDEPITQLGVLKPVKRPRKAIEQGSAIDGAVGDVSGYSVTAPTRTHDPVTGYFLPGNNANMAGRPTVLTPELEAQLFSLLEKGNPINLCCRLVGIDTSTLSKWRSLEAKGERPDLTAFFINMARSRALGELLLLNTARQGDSRDFSKGPAANAQWVLERAFGSQYAPRVNMKVEEMTDLTLDTITKICSDKDCGCYEQILAALQELESNKAE